MAAHVSYHGDIKNQLFVAMLIDTIEASLSLIYINVYYDGDIKIPIYAAMVI